MDSTYPILYQGQPATILLYMHAVADTESPKTGLTPTVRLVKYGSDEFVEPEGPIVELGAGFYKFDATATDLATAGILLVHATGTDAANFDQFFNVVPSSWIDLSQMNTSANQGLGKSYHTLG